MWRIHLCCRGLLTHTTLSHRNLILVGFLTRRPGGSTRDTMAHSKASTRQRLLLSMVKSRCSSGEEATTSHHQLSPSTTRDILGSLLSTPNCPPTLFHAPSLWPSQSTESFLSGTTPSAHQFSITKM